MTRKAAAIVGILLIALGAISLLFGGVTYMSHEDVFTVGDVEIEAVTHDRVPLPPLVGGASVLGGVFLLLISRR